MNEKNKQIVDSLLKQATGKPVEPTDKEELKEFEIADAAAKKLAEAWLADTKAPAATKSLAMVYAVRENINQAVAAMQHLDTEEKRMGRKSELLSTFFASLCVIVDPQQAVETDDQSIVIGQMASMIAVAVAQFHPLMQVIAADLFSKVAGAKVKKMQPELFAAALGKLLSSAVVGGVHVIKLHELGEPEQGK